MKRASLLSTITILVASTVLVYGQAPASPPPAKTAVPAPPASPVATPKQPAVNELHAAAGPTRVAVIDFNQAVTENSEGKAAYQKFQAAVGERQTAIAAETKNGEDLQNKLKAQGLTLSEDAKANLTRQIDAVNTHLTRMNEDAQKDMGDLQQQLFAPIAGRVRDVMIAYAKDLGFTMVFDESTQATNLVYWDPVSDITTEVIRRVDADLLKNPLGKPAAPKAPGAPAAAPKSTPAPPRPSPEE